MMGLHHPLPCHFVSKLLKPKPFYSIYNIKFNVIALSKSMVWVFHIALRGGGNVSLLKWEVGTSAGWEFFY